MVKSRKNKTIKKIKTKTIKNKKGGSKNSRKVTKTTRTKGKASITLVRHFNNTPSSPKKRKGISNNRLEEIRQTFGKKTQKNLNNIGNEIFKNLSKKK